MEMCCGCKNSANVQDLGTTADIQSWLVSNGPTVVSMPVYEHMYSVGSGVYKPIGDQVKAGGHAISCVGWGHDEEGEG